VALAAWLLSGCWLQAGYDAAHTWSNKDERTLTVANVASLEPVWSVDLAGSAQGEPIVSGDRVYLDESVDTGSYVDLSVQALDVATGATAWLQTLGSSPAIASQESLGLTPAVVGSELWTGFYMSFPSRFDLICYSRRVRLDAGTGAIVADESGFGSTAVPAGAVVAQIATPDNGCTHDQASVVVRDRASLATTWSSPLPAPGVSQGEVGPTVAGGRVFVTQASGIAMFAAGGCGAATCSPAWTFAVPFGTAPVGPVVAGPGGPGGEVFVVLYHVFGGPTSTELVALSAATGEVEWRAPLGGNEIDGFGVSLAVDGASVHAALSTSAGRRLQVFPVGGCEAAVCSPTWTAATTRDDAQWGSRPVVAGGVVYLPDAVGVHAFPAGGCGAATCAEIANIPVAGTPRSVTVSDGRLYVLTADNQMHAFAPA
jgi:outer membrane protein assembly factor BamB